MGSVAGLAALTCSAILPGILHRAFREPVRFAACTLAPCSGGICIGCVRLDQMNPLQSCVSWKKTLLQLRNSAGGQRHVHACSSISPQSGKCASKCRISQLFLENTYALGELKHVALTRNGAKINCKISGDSCSGKRAEGCVDWILVQKERGWISSGDGIRTCHYSSKEYLHCSNNFFVSLSG